MPDGVERTAPVPLPPGWTVTVSCCLGNAASIVVSLVRVTEHAPVPLQPPPVHAPNTEPVSAVAASVIVVPAGTVTEHAVPQLMPAGVDMTVPVSLPLWVMLSVTIAAVPAVPPSSN